MIEELVVYAELPRQDWSALRDYLEDHRTRLHRGPSEVAAILGIPEIVVRTAFWDGQFSRTDINRIIAEIVLRFPAWFPRSALQALERKTSLRQALIFRKRLIREGSHPKAEARRDHGDERASRPAQETVHEFYRYHADDTCGVCASLMAWPIDWETVTEH